MSFSTLFSWRVLVMDQTCQHLLYQPPLRIVVLLTFLFLALREQVSAPVRWRTNQRNVHTNREVATTHAEHIQILKIASRRFPRRWPLRLQKLRMLNKLLAGPQPALPSVSARSWNPLGRSDGSPATGSLGFHGPGSFDDNRITQDAELILSQALMMNMHEALCCYIFRVNTSTLECLLPAFNKPTRIHCKTNALSARLVFQTRGKCQDFVARCKDDGIPKKLLVHFAIPVPISWCAIPNHLKIDKIGRRFAPIWKMLSANLQEIFPERDVKGTFIVPALEVRSHILSIFDRRNGVGKLVFKLAPPRHEHLLDLTASDLCEPSISVDVL